MHLFAELVIEIDCFWARFFVPRQVPNRRNRPRRVPLLYTLDGHYNRRSTRPHRYAATALS